MIILRANTQLSLHRRKKRKTLTAVGIIAVSVMLFILFYNGLPNKQAAKDIQIPQGASTSEIAYLLQSRGMVKNAVAFKLVNRLINGNGTFQSGVVTLFPGMSYPAVIRELKAGMKPFARVTIPEGYEVGQIAQILSSKGLADQERFFREVESGQFAYPFLTDELPKGKNRLEGYLFPDTYHILPGMSEHEIIDMMLKAFQQAYTPEFAARQKELGLTTHQVVTLASIIQREATQQLDLVSSVFHNRLRSSNYRYLQSCATVIYVTKEPKARLSAADIRVESPYNTYRYPGLPPGPIGAPGAECLKAALYPAQSDYLFFTATGDGGHIFTKTYEEHLAASGE